MMIRDGKTGEERELPVCKVCHRPVFTIWDKEGRCITCSRNATLGENLPPPKPSRGLIETLGKYSK